MKIINVSSKLIIAILLTFILLLTGCGEVQPPEKVDHFDAAEKPFFVGTYTYMPQLFGELTMNEIVRILPKVGNSLNSAVIHGDLDKDDFEALLHIVKNLRDYLEEKQPNSVEEKSKLISLLELMVENEVGYTLENLITAVGTDVLTENIYPMLAYIMKMDTENIDGISMGEMAFDISKQEFETLVNILNGILDPEGDYHPVHDALKNLKDLPTIGGEGITFGDVRKAINDFMAGVKDSDIDIKKVMGAMSQLREDEEYALNTDVNNLMYSLGRLFSHIKNDTDGERTDFERVLSSLKELVEPDPQKRVALETLLDNALKGTIHLEGADALSGTIKGLATIDPQHAKDFDTAIYEYMFLRNIKGELRYDPETGEKADVQVSMAKALLYLLDGAYPINQSMEGATTSTLLSLISTPELQMEGTDNLLEYAVGLMVKACYEYPESYKYISGRTYPDPLEGLDWLWFEQDLYFTIFKIDSVDSMVNLLTLIISNPFVFNLVKQAMPVIKVINDVLPMLDVAMGHTGDQYTTGDQHKLFTLMAPILKYFYDTGRVVDLVHMATYLNEIDASKTYIPLGKSNATLEQEGGFLNTLEGPHGRGLLYYALRGDSEKDNNGDVLDPMLDLMIRVLRKLDATDHEGSTLLDTLFTGSKEEAKEKTDIIELLFDRDKTGECLLDKLYRILDDNHENLVIAFNSMGNILNAIPNDLLLSDDIIDTLLDEDFLEALKQNLSDADNRSAMTSMIRSVAELIGITDDDLLDAVVAMVDAILLSSENMIDDMEMILPILNDFLSTLIPDVEAEKENAGSLIDTMVTEMETESDLSRNAKILGYKLLNIYDETYHEEGVITNDTPIMDAINHYTGKSGMYDIEPIINFLRALISDNGNLLWSLIGKEESAGKSDEKEDLMSKIFGPNKEYMISKDLVKVMFNSYDGKDPAALVLFGLIHLENPYGMPIHMNGLLSEITTFIQNTTNNLEPGSEEYDVIFDLFDFLTSALVIN